MNSHPARMDLKSIRSRSLESIGAALDPFLAEVTEAARRDITASLNNSLRRMKQAGTREVWAQTVLEAAAPFCGRAALVTLVRGLLRLDGQELPLAEARAFAEAANSLDTLVTAGTATEIPAPILEQLGGPSDGNVYLFPLVKSGEAVAILCASPMDGSDIDVSALELLSSVGAESIPAEPEPEPEPEPAPAPAPELVSIAAPRQPAEPQEVREARRFARIRTAEIILKRTRAVREGRASKNLYGTLRVEIDAGREAYRRHFFEKYPAMPDYFHAELLRTLAKGDASLLGPDYPGALC